MTIDPTRCVIRLAAAAPPVRVAGDRGASCGGWQKLGWLGVWNEASLVLVCVCVVCMNIVCARVCVRPDACQFAVLRSVRQFSILGFVHQFPQLYPCMILTRKHANKWAAPNDEFQFQRSKPHF